MAFDLGKSGFGDKISKMEKLHMIPLDDIQENSQNFYSKDGIPELAASIEMVGLLHPISVVADGKNYRLVSGHRRLAAYQMLYMNAERGTEKFHEYSRIPAIVLRDMEDLKGTLALVTANSTARELTYDEKLKQEKILRETLQAMKDAGMDVPKSLGKYIADQMGVSQNEVSRMNSVNKNLIPEAREKVASGEMNANQAYELSRKPESEQKEAVGKTADYPESDSLGESLERAETNRIIEKMKPSMKMLAEKTVGAWSKSDAIALLKISLKSSGGYDYFGTSTGCSFGEPGKRTATISWPKVYDYLSLYAIRQLASNADFDDDEPDQEQEADGWQTGTPQESGEYAAVFVSGGVEIKHICFYDNVVGKWRFRKGGTIIDAESIMWFPLPEPPEVM